MKHKILPFLIVSFILFVPFSLYILFSFKIIDEIIFMSIIYSYLIMLLGFGLGVLVYVIGIKKSNPIFLALVWGGMFFRLILLTVMTFLALKFLEINQNTFIFSSFIFYILYLIFEVIYLNQRKNK
jgi:hypothetical protein